MAAEAPRAPRGLQMIGNGRLDLVSPQQAKDTAPPLHSPCIPRPFDVKSYLEYRVLDVGQHLRPQLLLKATCKL